MCTCPNICLHSLQSTHHQKLYYVNISSLAVSPVNLQITGSINNHNDRCGKNNKGVGVWGRGPGWWSGWSPVLQDLLCLCESPVVMVSGCVWNRMWCWWINHCEENAINKWVTMTGWCQLGWAGACFRLRPHHNQCLWWCKARRHGNAWRDPWNPTAEGVK